jgi:hypothetical protein
MKTIQNIKRFSPFSNGNEALSWMSSNCNKCKYYKCYVKKILGKGFIDGKITINRAKWIGLEDNQLKLNCDKFTETTNRKVKVKNTSKEYEENFMPNTF